MKKLEISLENNDFENIERRAKEKSLSVGDYVMKRVFMDYNSNEAVSMIDALIDRALAQSDDSAETMEKIKQLVQAAEDLLEEDEYGAG